MKNGKAAGTSGMVAEVFKALEEESTWLTDLLNNIMSDELIPEEWRRSTITPIHKKKGGIINCENYRGVKLTEYGLKILVRIIIDKRLREIVDIRGRQC